MRSNRGSSVVLAEQETGIGVGRRPRATTLPFTASKKEIAPPVVCRAGSSIAGARRWDLLANSSSLIIPAAVAVITATPPSANLLDPEWVFRGHAT